jgi:hypothetical protein
MNMTVWVYLVSGLVVLVAGAELLVQGASRLAVGSNIFNVLAVLGLAALIAPHIPARFPECGADGVGESGFGVFESSAECRNDPQEPRGMIMPNSRRMRRTVLIRAVRVARQRERRRWSAARAC